MEVEDEDWHKFLHSNSSHLELPKTSCTMSLMAALSLLFFKAYNRLSYKGLENLPAQGAFILAPNHESYLDGPLLTACLPGTVLHRSYFYADEKHVRGRVAQALARHHNVVLMERGNLRNSILKLAEVLKQGRNLVIFPEGTRSRDGKLRSFYAAGFRRILDKAPMPVAVCALDGGYRISTLDGIIRNLHNGSYRVKILKVYPAPTSKQEQVKILEEGKELIQAQLDQWHREDESKK